MSEDRGRSMLRPISRRVELGFEGQAIIGAEVPRFGHSHSR